MGRHQLLFMALAHCLIVGLFQAHCAGQDLDAETLLNKLKEKDSLYESGFTATGTYVDSVSMYRDTLPRRLTWKLTMGDGKIAYEQRVVEVLDWEDVLGPNEEPPETYLGPGGLFMILKTTIFVGREYYGAYDWLAHQLPEGPVASWPEGEPGPVASGALLLYRLDDPGHLWKIDRRMHLMGRWYAKGRAYPRYVDRITSVTRREDGLLSCIGDGSRGRRELKWKLVVDPEAAYMVRSAVLDVVGIEDEHTEMMMSGTKWHGTLCVPETVKLHDELMPQTVTSVSSKTDEEFLKKCQAVIHGPYLVHTTLTDMRLDDVSFEELEAGEAWRRRVRIGERAFALNVTGWVHGDATNLETLQGTIVVLAFWDSAHKSSAELVATLNALANQCADVIVIAIHSASGDPATLGELVEAESVAFDVALDKTSSRGYPGATFERYGVKETPAVYVLDTDAKVRFQDIPLAAAEESVRMLLGED